ncbi:glutamate--tRNA ligase [Burkholderia pseudomallei MSHR7504]|nr:glutamate--tRNA ligase [Burkholderia pseudomallei MSHR7504]
MRVCRGAGGSRACGMQVRERVRVRVRRGWVWARRRDAGWHVVGCGRTEVREDGGASDETRRAWSRSRARRDEEPRRDEYNSCSFRSGRVRTRQSRAACAAASFQLMRRLRRSSYRL